MKEATKHEASLIRDGVMDDDTCLVVSAADYDALRQQLADVSNERDGLQEQVRRLNSEGRTITLSGCEIKEEDLIWGVMRNLHGNRRNTLPRWALVRDAFGTGSGVATALCRRFNLNPEEVLKS
ncbi:hypothetical protein [Pseudomonas viridiflava]|uniref:hypothetical protein n=1 Tax=Pseudomonas viridiflava TaxID=33069 RepID=UPI001F086F8A|nr:hypothetical protein [Pseudomonas viridiflava]